MKKQIRDKALSLGFSAVGFAPAQLAPEAGLRLKEFVAAGKHGEMNWLAERTTERSSPNALWAEAKSVIVVGVNYGPDHNPLDNLAHIDKANISVYARGRDYHDVLKKQLRVLARWVAETYSTEVKLFVDTAPVMEKPLAQQAGLGWQGKHTNLVSREFGSWLFLGEVFTALELTPDTAHNDACGACTACLDICPTQAITAPYQLDARRCISYLTIEHKGSIPLEFRKAIGNRIYGCDDCLAVCPWNKFAKASTTAELTARPENNLPALLDLAQLDDAAFRARFSGSPIKRIGRERFVRNVCIAIGNSSSLSFRRKPESSTAATLDPDVRPSDSIAVLLKLINDSAPLVRGAAIWALSQLDPNLHAAHSTHAQSEPDQAVALEWRTV
jgi:epoxyqueuosine reductase